MSRHLRWQAVREEMFSLSTKNTNNHVWVFKVRPRQTSLARPCTLAYLLSPCVWHRAVAVCVASASLAVAGPWCGPTHSGAAPDVSRDEFDGQKQCPWWCAARLTRCGVLQDDPAGPPPPAAVAEAPQPAKASYWWGGKAASKDA